MAVASLDSRRVTLQPFPSLVCPEGHPIRGLARSLQEVTFTCSYPLARGTCDRLVYVITDWQTRGRVTLSLVVAVTKEEIRRMRLMPLQQKLEFLGLTKEMRDANQSC